MWEYLRSLCKRPKRDVPESTSLGIPEGKNGFVSQLPVNWRQPDASPEAIERDVAYAVKIGHEYLELLGSRGRSVRGAVILELGPGHNYGAALVMACHGADVAVADRFPVSWLDGYHDIFYESLWRRLAASRADIDTMPIRRCLDVSGTHESVAIIDAPAEDLSALGNDSFDIILSNAVLEHVHDPERVTRELFRVTRPGGIGLHQIDFRDHRDFSRPLEYLLLDTAEFEDMFAERNGECGRQTRHYEMREFFRAAGFNVAEFDANWLAPEEYLDEFMARLRESSSAYKGAPRDELRMISGRFILEKPSNP